MCCQIYQHCETYGNLFVRFTEAPNNITRQLEIFKHTCGCLKGWTFARGWISSNRRYWRQWNCVEQKTFAFLYIEVWTASSELSKVNNAKIYQLVSQWRSWSIAVAFVILGLKSVMLFPMSRIWRRSRLNVNTKIARHGFPIVLDFGGIAHVYCGSTLDACLGDVLPWHTRPTREAALWANIIKSRVKETNKLLLTQLTAPIFIDKANHEVVRCWWKAYLKKRL